MDSSIISIATSRAICAALVLFCVIWGCRTGRRDAHKLPLPPGPKPLPIVGNINDLPPPGHREYEHWLKHKDLYGPISSVTVLGTTIIILNDASTALELLEKRSSIYSSRAHMVFAGELCGLGDFLVMQPYNDRLRAMRKRTHAVIGTQTALSRTIPLQDTEAHRFLFRVLQRPAEMSKHLRTEAGALILKITYNYSIDTENPDPLVAAAERVIDEFSRATMPGAWLVDAIPILKHVPSWFPGAGFKRLAKEWKSHFVELADWPYRFVKHEMKHNRHEPSFVSRLFDTAGDNITTMEEDLIRDSAVSLFAGGADTMFFFAMMLHPDIQQRAQQEIDRVIGTNRLPTIDDRSRLPYVNAVLQEALRWHPIAPLGVPHCAAAEDVYRDYRIPEGSILITNVWGFAHDPAVYTTPMSFDPDRFLGEKPEPDPQNLVFGFGRRICPGRLLADSSMWLTIAKSLAVFDVTKPLDKDGREITPEVQFTAGILSRPGSLQMSIKPRSAKHEALIREVEVKHPWEESSADVLTNLRR